MVAVNMIIHTTTMTYCVTTAISNGLEDQMVTFHRGPLEPAILILGSNITLDVDILVTSGYLVKSSQDMGVSTSDTEKKNIAWEPMK